MIQLPKISAHQNTQDNVPRLFLVGIGGIGMSGLAQLLRFAGYEVAGSDRAYNAPDNAWLFDALRNQGIAIYPQDGSGVKDFKPDLLIASSAVEEGNPDFIEGIPIMHRAAALAQALDLFRPEAKLIAVTEPNIAKHQPTEYSWSYDYKIGDFANDDDFSSSWMSHPLVEQPWWEVTVPKNKAFHRITILEGKGSSIEEYRLNYLKGGKWTTIFEGKANPCRLKQHSFPAVKAEKVRITVLRNKGEVKIAEFGIYAEM